MRWWEKTVGGQVRGRIIALLRRGERTVEDLAADLGVTDNAVRAQLQTLEREGVVHQSRIRHEGAVGKPATLYAIPPDAESLFSTAYAPVLTALIASLEGRLDPRELDDIFRDVGRRLADEARVDAKGRPKKLDAGVRAAAALLTALGAEIDVEKTDDGFLLRGYACPLSAAVRAHPNTCHAIEELVAGVAGTSAAVRECCDRDGQPRCRFAIRQIA